MESGWIMWVAVLVVWTLVGLVVAFIFGGLARRAETAEGTVLAPKLSYLGRHKRAKGPLRATETKIRRVAGGQGRH